MNHLSIDIETKSSINIGKAGAYKYAQSDDFEILLLAYKLNDNKTEVVDLANGEKIPNYIIACLRSDGVIKHAYNAAFEWWCLNQAGYDTPIHQWQCTMIHGLYCGYPAGLEAIGNAIGLSEEKKKLTIGKALIKYFCTPCKATKSNGGRLWNLPKHDIDKWNLFKEYNAGDVEAEYAIYQRLKAFPMPEQEWIRWQRDVMMNATGVKVDKTLIEGALQLDDMSTYELTQRAKLITGLDNPNSNAQLLNWVREKTGDDIPNLQKATVEKLLTEDYDDDVKEALRIRQKLGKTSVSKYKAMASAKGDDDRVRGLLQFYGANRTGRWAGRLVQIQNLPRNHLKTLDLARNLIRGKKYDELKLIYGNIPDTLSQLIRTAFIPSSNECKLIVSDFSAIEARVIAWLAGEQWAVDVFATTGKIYEATASQMFHVDLDKIVKGNPEYDLRQKGKVATLALGYQGGTGALVAMGALNMGLDEEELPDIVSRWRNANKNIVNFWYAIENAAVDTVVNGTENTVNGITTRLEFDLIYGQLFLTVQLPSGRKLFYPKPHILENKFGKMAVHYYGLNQTTKKWGVESTYGGKLTENIVQAIARDCLAETLDRLYERGYKVVMHIHDEVVIDAVKSKRLDDVNTILSMPIAWAPGLVLKGAGFESEYYMKD